MRAASLLIAGFLVCSLPSSAAATWVYDIAAIDRTGGTAVNVTGEAVFNCRNPGIAGCDLFADSSFFLEGLVLGYDTSMSQLRDFNWSIDRYNNLGLNFIVIRGIPLPNAIEGDELEINSFGINPGEGAARCDWRSDPAVCPIDDALLDITLAFRSGPAPAPEPGTLALVGLGLAGFLRRRLTKM
jgi:hypothetical protein